MLCRSFCCCKVKCILMSNLCSIWNMLSAFSLKSPYKADQDMPYKSHPSTLKFDNRSLVNSFNFLPGNAYSIE